MAKSSLLWTKLPAPVLEGGDVIIHTSEHPNGIFVVHKEQLASKSRFFKAVLGQQWGRIPKTFGDGSDGPKVYEMDLQFDPETRLALPVIRDPTRLANSLTKKALETSTAGPRKESPYFWYEKQPEHHRSRRERRDHQNHEYLYPAMYGWSVKTPTDADGSDGPDTCERFMDWWFTQKDLFDHARDIWKCLLALMYGHEISLPDHCACVGASDLRRGARHAGRDHATDWQDAHVDAQALAQCLCMSLDYMYIAYNLNLPVLYLDAVKHVIGLGCFRRYQNSEHGFSLDDNEEIYALLLAGALEYEQELGRLRGQICSSELFRPTDLLNCPYSCEYRQKWYSKDYQQVTQDCFDKQLHHLIASWSTSSAHGSIFAFGRWWSSVIHILRWLIDLAPDTCEDCDEDLIIEMGLLELPQDEFDPRESAKAWAEANGIELLRLAHEVGDILRSLKWETGAMSKDPCRYSTNDVDCNCNTPDTGDFWTPCAACHQAKYQPDDYWVSIDFDRVYATREVKPWPLNGELKAEQVFPKQIECVPASHTHLESIGLGSKFKHVSSRSIIGIEMVEDDVWSGEGFDRLRSLFQDVAPQSPAE